MLFNIVENIIMLDTILNQLNIYNDEDNYFKEIKT